MYASRHFEILIEPQDDAHLVELNCTANLKLPIGKYATVHQSEVYSILVAINKYSREEGSGGALGTDHRPLRLTFTPSMEMSARGSISTD